MEDSSKGVKYLLPFLLELFFIPLGRNIQNTFADIFFCGRVQNEI